MRDSVQSGNTSISLPLNTDVTKKITFDTPYSSAPSVVLDVKETGSPMRLKNTVVFVKEVTANDFTIYGRQDVTSTTFSVGVSWIAAS